MQLVVLPALYHDHSAMRWVRRALGLWGLHCDSSDRWGLRVVRMAHRVLHVHEPHLSLEVEGFAQLEDSLHVTWGLCHVFR